MHNDNETKPSGLTGAIFWIAIAFSFFQLITAAFSPLSSQVVRAIHVGFVILLVFALHPPFHRNEGALRTVGKVLGWTLGLTGFVFSLYHWVFEADLTQRADGLVVE